MNVIYLIIIYLIICLSIVIFNIFAILHSKGSNRLNTLKLHDYKTKIKTQLLRIKEGYEVEENHKNYLQKKLKSGNELIIFDEIVSTYKLKENKYIDTYLNECKNIFINLIYHYEKRTNTELAYFLSIIRDYNILVNNNNHEVEKVLFKTLLDESFYCRDNAYLAICKLANPSKLKDALIDIGTSEKFFHQNLISNGLNIYNGNHQELIKILLDNFNKFQTYIQYCIIEYLSFNDYDNSAFVYNVLTKTKDRNLLLTCIKYFEYIHYDLVLEFLIKNIEEKINTDLELCLACVKALRNYPNSKSIDTIKKAIYSDNFKIRDAACESLAIIRLDINPKELKEFLFEEETDDMYSYHILKNKSKVVK